MLQNLQHQGQLPSAAGPDGAAAANSADNHATGPLDIATESIDMKPPPEKKMKWEKCAVLSCIWFELFSM